MAGSNFVLDSLGETMTAFGNTLLRIEGNTDNTGSRTANRSLSQKRADAVKDYLISNHKIDRSAFRRSATDRTTGGSGTRPRLDGSKIVGPTSRSS